MIAMNYIRWVLGMLLVLAVLFPTPQVAEAQTLDTLPQRPPDKYVPSSLSGFSLASRTGLTATERKVFKGVVSGTKAFWEKTNLSPRLVVFDVTTDVYRFDSPTNARRSVQKDFRKMVGEFGRDTIAGLPVVTVANKQVRSSADHSIGYQQGTLGIRVSATQSVTNGSADMGAVRRAARNAFRAVIEEARSNR